MTTKKFTVIFTSDAQTHWLNDDAHLAHALEILARTVGHANTRGTVPAVTVTVEEAPCDGCRFPLAHRHTCSRHA